MRSLLLKGMGDGTLIGLLQVTPKPHLRVITPLQTNPFSDLRLAQDSFI
jgi:hypothetical protein